MPRHEIVSPVSRGCAKHEAHPIYECHRCQNASVIVVQSAMTGKRRFIGIGKAVVRPNAPRPESIGR